ncbi:glutamyl-tRNA(Gln) amidotransferase subunit A [Thermoproteus uzoniensis 768-20]|uniref:Glutamyl-tRNA(Gln) amidotransferase subunit A n=1 Tax=Thermoproteus uzoniensis (strain 768-20) TaxID=999630 RepID=F2L5F8_THEU7|nr:amidase [Thermoproteus uzoniensis]AEA12329.1 glutamyl-tRNA(Gln) amidotransferase subunit A [Thermoproteus uzoniensis 768-20]
MIDERKVLDLLTEPSFRPGLVKVVDEVRRGVADPVEVVSRSLDAAKRYSHLNAYITLLDDVAMERAESLRKALRRGLDRGRLFGVPVSLKDNILTRGVRTTMGSRIFQSYVPAINARVVDVLESQGAVVVGKANLHEFASGVSNKSSVAGPARNPHDPSRISGGSSGGSAVSVAIGSAYISVGTDTSGSVRIPAALCGVVGYKPTYGLIDIWGVFPLAWTLDTVGVLARSISDIAYFLYAVTGDLDYVVRISTDLDIRKITIGYLELDENNKVEKYIMDIISKLDSEGYNIRRISINIESYIETQRVIRLAEASAIHRELYREYRDLYSPDVANLIEQGFKYSAVDYLAAQRSRSILTQSYRSVFKSVDAVVTPTVPVVAPPIEQLDEMAFRALATRYTTVANLVGSPALSLPVGLVEGLPVGLQLLGDVGHDAELLAIAKSIEVAVSKT